MIEVPFSDRKQIGQLQKKLREGYARIAALEDALDAAMTELNEQGDDVRDEAIMKIEALLEEHANSGMGELTVVVETLRILTALRGRLKMRESASAVCYEGDHDRCLRPGCGCDCHQARKKENDMRDKDEPIGLKNAHDARECPDSCRYCDEPKDRDLPDLILRGEKIILGLEGLGATAPGSAFFDTVYFVRDAIEVMRDDLARSRAAQQLT